VEQLAEGGRLVAPVGPLGGEQQLVRVTKKTQNQTVSEDLMSVVYSRMEKEIPMSNHEHKEGLQETIGAALLELQAKTDALREWQNNFKDRNGRKPAAKDMALDPEAKKLLERFKELKLQLKRSQAMLNKHNNSDDDQEKKML